MSSIMNLFRHLGANAALEEAATGRGQAEIEHVFYAKFDLRWLQATATSIEDQEQWELRIAKTETNAMGGRMRIRKTRRQGVSDPAQYVLTIKTKLPERGELEVAIPASEDGFAQFKAMSECGMVKRRHTLTCEGTASQWEVDVFFKPDGTPQEWCKIDFELSEPGQKCPPLPLEFTEAIQNGPGGNPETQAFIRNLYEAVFISKNDGTLPSVPELA